MDPKKVIIVDDCGPSGFQRRFLMEAYDVLARPAVAFPFPKLDIESTPDFGSPIFFRGSIEAVLTRKQIRHLKKIARIPDFTRKQRLRHRELQRRTANEQATLILDEY